MPTTSVKLLKASQCFFSLVVIIDLFSLQFTFSVSLFNVASIGWDMCRMSCVGDPGMLLA